MNAPAFTPPADPGPARLPALTSDLAAGALIAVVTLAYASGFAQLVFGGALEPHVGQALIASLVGSVVIMAVLALGSSLPFCVGGPDANPSAILAATLAVISAQIAGATEPDALLPTLLMFVFLTSAGCGLVLACMGARRWGRYVRYAPYPVVGGFLAGTGYLLLTGAYRMLTGRTVGRDAFEDLSALHPLAPASAAAVVVALLVLTRRVRHHLVVPAVIVAAIALFHAARLACGIDLGTARDLGLLLDPPRLDEWRHAANFPYERVRWDVVLAHTKDFLALTIVVALTTLLNTTSLEVATEREADADRELRALGLANFLSGLAGGMVGATSFNRSLLNLKAGARSARAACFAAVLVAFVTLVAPGAVGFLPKPVLTGLIAYLGLGLLGTWIVEARSRMTGLDHLVVLLILVAIAALGVVPGVVIGVVIACLGFVVTLSRSPTVKYAFTGVTRRSNVERPPGHAAWLRARGASLHGFVLQGVLFFGTAHQVLETIRANLERTRFALLDFRLVHDVDGSATFVLAKLRKLCREAGIELLFTGLRPEVETVLRRGGFSLDQPGMRRFTDLDHGLEWCEDALLAEAGEPAAPPASLDGMLTPDELRSISAHCETETLAAGARLASQGEPGDAMFLVESGRVGVYLRLDEHGALKRLHSYGPGTLLGEMGLYTRDPRSADMIAEEESRVLRLAADSVAALEKDRPELALKLHRHVVRTLAERLRATNEEVRLLL